MKASVLVIWEVFYAFPLLLISYLSRFATRKIDVGIGPEPLINNVYHSAALKLFGYRSETFVRDVFFITHDFDKVFVYKNKLWRFVILDCLNLDFLYALITYKSLYIYFNGACLNNTLLLWRIEPLLLKLANIKVIVMPYGSDIQLFDQTPNLLFKNRMSSDYPHHKYRYEKMRKKRTLWTTYSDCVIGGCDWVDYLYHWDRLLVAHFSVDTNYIKSIKDKENSHKTSKNESEKKPFRIFHAPNHKKIKGTASLIQAVEKLQNDGFSVELILAEKKPNKEILEEIIKADLVVDQLVVGWYAMFAIEAMALGKPVICYLRDDLLSFYRAEGLINANEPPLINSDISNIQPVLKACLEGEINLEEFSGRGIDYVERTHSLEYIGSVFNDINLSLAIYPSLRKSSNMID